MSSSNLGEFDVVPCPWCARTDALKYSDSFACVLCFRCKARGPRGFPKEKSINNWNERKQP